MFATHLKCVSNEWKRPSTTLVTWSVGQNGRRCIHFLALIWLNRIGVVLKIQKKLQSYSDNEIFLYIYLSFDCIIFCTPVLAESAVINVSMQYSQMKTGIDPVPVIVQNVVYEAIPLAILFLIQGCKMSNQGMLKMEN